jgi:aromatic ring-opening dioxygenase catalytic subunit (LigB family)
MDSPFGTRDELALMRTYLEGLRDVPGAAPKAVLIVSAHWEEAVPTVMTSPAPPMLYDYYGFPDDTYTITWPAPGEPTVAKRVRELLESGGFRTAEDPARGFDHGTFVPLKLAYPGAEVPIVQLSLKKGLDPAEHLAMGRALAPLRDEGVFVVGSGMTYHNLRAFGPQAAPVSEAFDAWLRETTALPEVDRDRRLAEWTRAPDARAAHPREEHLLPLMVLAGTAGADAARIPYNGTILGLRLSAHHFG